MEVNLDLGNLRALEHRCQMVERHWELGEPCPRKDSSRLHAFMFMLRDEEPEQWYRRAGCEDANQVYRKVIARLCELYNFEQLTLSQAI